MIKATMKLTSAVLTSYLFASSAYAAPISLTAAQMDSVAAGAFVCPVITTDAVLNGPGFAIAGGDYSILGPDVSVPVHATNDDGLGTPGGAHASPGDTTYTAIWY